MTSDEATQARRTKLLEAKTGLMRRLAALERDATTELNKDFAEQATELENRDVMIALGREGRAELVQIERALERMEAGSYGICESCGKPIAPARLDAHPASSRCIECAR
jgi:RNA polymerase-binding protein DksA